MRLGRSPTQAPKQVPYTTRLGPRGVRFRQHRIPPLSGSRAGHHTVESFHLPADFDPRQVDDDLLDRLGIYRRAMHNPAHLEYWRQMLRIHRYVVPDFQTGKRSAAGSGSQGTPSVPPQSGGDETIVDALSGHWAGMSVHTVPRG